MTIPKPVITREHGSWALLLVPITGGALCAGLSWNHLYLTLSALGLFLCYVPLHTLLRARRGRPLPPEKRAAAVFWVIAYGSIGALAAVPLLLQGMWLLLVFFGGACVLFARNYVITLRHPRTLEGDLVAMAGLTFGAPAAFYVASGNYSVGADIVWVATVGFFAASVFHVHMKISASATKRPTLTIAERLRLGVWNILYLGVLWSLVVYAAARNVAPAVSILYVPMSLQLIAGTLMLSPRTNFKHLGLALLGQSLLFAVLLYAVWHMFGLHM